MPTLFATAGSGNCFKPFLAMRQLGIAFDVVNVDVLSGQTRSPAWISINPAGSVPYLLQNPGEGLAESNAMLWPLAEGSHLMPQSSMDRGIALQWMFFEQSRLEPFISPARFLSFIAPERGVGRESDIAGWREKAQAGLALLDAHLAKRDFIAGGAYSIGDIGVFGYVHLADEAGIDLGAFPAVTHWIARVQSTKGYTPISELCANASLFNA